MSRAAKIAVGVVVGLVVVFCVGSFAIDRHLLDQTYARFAPSSPRLMLTDEDIAADYPHESVEFQLEGKTLRGCVYGARNDGLGLIVFRHGIFSQHEDYLALITALVDKGWKVFAYDAIGCGDSDGDSVIGFAQSPRDVHAAVQFARESGIDGGLPVVLVGHSWGAYGVAGALAYDDGVEACVAMSGFDTPNDIILESANRQMGPVAQTQVPFISLIGYLDFGGDGNRSAVSAIDASGVPTLVMHGTNDQVIRFDGASMISKRDRISNPHVDYVVKDEANRDGHNTYFYSRESQDYLAECTDELAALEQGYGGAAPQDALDRFLGGIDKKRANTADPELIDQIHGFLSSAIGQSSDSPE